MGSSPLLIFRHFTPMRFVSNRTSPFSTTRASITVGSWVVLLPYHANSTLASIKVSQYCAAHNSYSYPTAIPTRCGGECTPHELEHSDSIGTCCVHPSNRFVIDTYAISISCWQELFLSQKRTTHPPYNPDLRKEAYIQREHSVSCEYFGLVIPHL